MKIYFCILMVMGTAVLNISAQQETVTLQADKVFETLASKQTQNIDQEKIRKFGDNLGFELTKTSNPLEKAAKWLIKLQKKPDDFVDDKSKDKNVPNYESELMATELTIEYLKRLVDYKDLDDADPLKNAVADLKPDDLNRDLLETLGDENDRENRFAEIVIKMKGEFGNANLSRIREILKDSNSKQKLPYPLCLVSKNC